jgi:4-carboxymuconolactone decarboxylase
MAHEDVAGWATVTGLLPPVTSANATEEQAAVATEILSARGRLGKPVGNLFGMLLNSPGAARQVAAVGAYCRFGSGLAAAVREGITLAVAYRQDCAYEITSHEPLALAAGLDGEMLGALRLGALDDPHLPEDLRIAAKLAVALAAAGGVPDDVLGGAVERFGRDGAMDIVVTAGYYTMLGLFSSALRIPPDQGQDPSSRA